MKNKLSQLEIASLVRKGKNFTVPTKSDRRNVYECAKFLGKDLTVKQRGNEFFVIFI